MDVSESLGTAGRLLWTETLAEFDLTPVEQRLLLDACRLRDQLEALANGLQETGSVTAEGTVSPLMVEYRLLAAAFGRIAASLKLPGDTAPGRGGTSALRGVREYGKYKPKAV